MPPAPALASEAYACELIELYWASLLRDVPFTAYPGNALVAQAAAELTTLPSYAGPRNAAHQVTPALLFRGRFAGEDRGPYVSQFLLQPTTLGALKIDQQYQTFQAATDFMLDPVKFLAVQNGQATNEALTPQAPRYLHDGRGLAAYTHSDVLYQAYFIASLVLGTLNNGKAVPANPGIPYRTWTKQNAFASLGGPDLASTLGAVAGEAIRAVWYQKWWVHLRHRPESGGGIVHLQSTGQGGTIQGRISPTALGSQAVAAAFAANHSYLLSQAFPEGSPTHPAYPTGHGAVAGACITVLKFFFDGSWQIPQPMVTNAGGTALVPYVAPPGEAPLTVEGELNKLACNISFGHGIHAGIHWRSDTDASVQHGEAVALSFLRDKIQTYNERFSVTLNRIDGTPVTLSNL